MKVGIGAKPDRMDLADYVLSHFSRGEWEQMEDAFMEAADAVTVMVSQGMEAAMNRFNKKKAVAPADGEGSFYGQSVCQSADGAGGVRGTE